MKKFNLLIVFGALLISGCSPKEQASSNIEISSNSTSESVDSSNSEVSSFSSSSSSSIYSSSISSSTSPSTSSSNRNSNTSITSSTSTKENNKYSLIEWTTFSFYDEYGPKYHEDWQYDYGGSKNPSGCLYKCPNEKANGDGIEFADKKQSMTSPTFNSWKKIELHFELWFSSRTSTKYKSTDGQPQLLISKYKSDGSYIGDEQVFLTKSNVPSNGTTYDLHLYIRDTSMTSFKIKYNNSIANGDSGYTIVMHEIRMKGWDYE